jgi:hypothetical protein
MSGAWKNQERLVASWFGVTRNPLSGRNNRDDDGGVRCGDIIYKHAVVEVKRRQAVNMQVGIETRTLARSCFKPWIVYEFKTGCAEMVKLTMDHETAAAVSSFLDEYWKEKAHGVETH